MVQQALFMKPNAPTGASNMEPNALTGALAMAPPNAQTYALSMEPKCSNRCSNYGT